jgi:allophanate hydrolase subunit 2
LRWIPSTRCRASFGSGNGAPLFNDDLLAFQAHAASLLPSFAM